MARLHFQSLAKKYESGEVPKATKDVIVHKTLEGRFSKPVIDVMIDPNRKRVQNAPESDYSLAMKIRRSSKKEALNLVRTVIPLPGLTGLQEKFSWLHVLPGLFKAVIAYYKLKIPHMKPLEELTACCFDEINLSEQGSLDSRYDLFKLIQF